ncbi:ABC transporter substrate-binding protein [Actinoplanes sp. NPDC051411]|uniref:ABC transporter substrate-binding protein n=1 Tax=Actinoplanes sp. NPDC051411 TaxID=3155522 RepID=UPI00342FF2DA
MSVRRLRWISSGVLAIALAAVTAGCGSDDSKSDGSNKYGLAQGGTITSALTAGGVPFASVDASGKPVGLLVDLNNIIAKNLGLKIAYKSTDLNGAFAGITANKYDLLSIGLVATPERAKSVYFTKPIYYGTNAVIVGKDSAVTGAADLTGKRVGAGANSTQYDYAEKSLAQAKLVSEASNSAAISQLEAGNVNAIVLGGTQASTLMKTSSSKFKIAFTAQQTTPGEIAINKNLKTFQTDYEAQLAKLVEDGTFLKLYDQYLGVLGLPFPTSLYSTWPTLKAQVEADPKANPAPSAAS